MLSISHSIKPRAYPFGGPIDEDAAAFIKKAGITDGVLIGHINTFFLDIKGKGDTTNGTNLFIRGIVGYPYTGGTSLAHTVNMFDPDSFQGIFVNSPTHATGGVTYDGSTQRMRTGLIPDTSIDDVDVSFSFILGTNITASANDIITGANDGFGRIFVYPKRTTNLSTIQMPAADLPSQSDSTAIDTTKVITWSVRSSSDREAYEDSVSKGTDTGAAGALPQIEMYVGAYNNNGSPNFFFGGQSRGVFIFDGLVSAEVTDLEESVNKFNLATR